LQQAGWLFVFSSVRGGEQVVRCAA